MVRAATRSQKAPKASQSQPRQSQRGRNNDPEDEDENQNGEDDDGDAHMDVDEDGEGARADGDDDIIRKAHQLVRLAVFTEQKRIPLRREDISKKVLGSNTRIFNRVFEMAQLKLATTFGQELVELRSRAELDKMTAAPGDEDLEEAHKATGIKKKTAAAGSKTYMLRSILDPIIIEHAALTDEQILEDEAADVPSDDDDDASPRSYGSIISWSNADQLGAIGILYVVLSLILVSGRVMADADLRANLKRLRLGPTSTVSFSVQTTHPKLPVDQYLTTLIRQGYLDRTEVGSEKKKGKGKRVRATQADDDSGITYEWRWGARAQSEVGEKGIAQFIAEFMVGDLHGQDEGDDDDEGARARGKTKRATAERDVEKMTKGIERAAGGNLAELM